LSKHRSLLRSLNTHRNPNMRRNQRLLPPLLNQNLFLN
jgi:hypothetical protein